MAVKLIRITVFTIYLIIYVSQRLFINLLLRFTVTCVLYFCPTNPANSNVLGKSPIRDSNTMIGKLEIAIGGFGNNAIHT